MPTQARDQAIVAILAEKIGDLIASLCKPTLRVPEVACKG